MAGNETVPVRTAMIGDHHVASCLSAASVGLVMGIDLTTVARGLEAVDRVPGRLDRIECGQPFGVYVDCADTADRLAVCLKTLRQVTEGRVLCVVSCDGPQRREERPLLGRVVERSADMGVITSGCSGSESPLGTIHDILDGYDRPARAHVIPTRNQAILWMLGQAQAGDTVLIAGSHHAFATVGNDRGIRCPDSEIARSWLYESASDTAKLLGSSYG
jgi:UDP-N-acetylmuramoyl-L-alanyl-D-glutamate--2,6-diaminopimelate ligase